MSRRIFTPLLLLLARLTHPDLVRSVLFLKAENAMLRKRLPRRITPERRERDRLLRLGTPLGVMLKELVSIVTYRTFLRWKSGANGKRRTKCVNRHPTRKPEDIRLLVIKIGRETGWGLTRIVGELKKLGVPKISRSTVKNILVAEGLDPGPKTGEGSWDEFLKIHWKTLWACDFFTKDVWTAIGRCTVHVLFFIELHTRRVHIAGITRNPDSVWMAQAARNMRMLLEDNGIGPSYIIKDGDKKFTPQFDAIIESTGANVKRLPRRSPNLNAYAESWVGAIKREVLNHFVVFGMNHLEHLVCTYAAYHNSVRCHTGLGNRPVAIASPPPHPEIRRSKEVACHSWLGGLLKHYERAA